MKHSVLAFCLACLAGFASASENWWQYSPDRGFRFESLPAQIVLYEPGWNALYAKKLNQQNLLSGAVTPGKEGVLHCEMRFQSPEPRKVQELALEFQLPAKTPFLLLDKLKVDLPRSLNEQKWIILGGWKAKSLTIPLASGASLILRGDLDVWCQDNRRFGGSRFLLRLRFSPKAGMLEAASLKFEVERKGVVSLPQDLAGVMNRGLRDEVAGDGQGGWTDQGPENDLRQLPAGLLRFGGASFRIVDEENNRGKAAIVLGRNVSGACEFPLQGRGNWLYFLHASAWGARNAEIGEIDVTFADGSGQTFPVIQNRDVGNWWMPSHFKNATNVWSVENPQCYVGLYLSQFPLKRNDPVRIRLRSGAGACWMIPAISLGNARIPVEQFDKTVYLVPGREWATLDFPVTVQKGSVLDFSDQLDAPAGKYGPVRISPEGHFVFAQAPERRIRFFGVNLSYGANFPSRANAEKLAERLAAVGYNVVRFHHQDGGLTGSGDEMFNRENLDRLDYFIAALKKRGIYFMTDLYVSRVRPCYAPLAGAFPVKHYSPALFKALIPILPEAMEDWKLFCRRWLLHENPYTGMVWGRDPALFQVSLVNEGNLDFFWNTTAETERLYREKFFRWMAERFPAESATASRSEPRFLQFLNELQRNALLEQKRFLRDELKLDLLCAGINMESSPALTAQRNLLDVVDDHLYFDHPSFPVSNWKLPASYRQYSAIRRKGNNFPAALFSSRIYGKPFTVSEFNYCAPNRFRCESGALLGAYAALQDYDALIRFDWASSEQTALQPAPLSAFAAANDPLAQFSDRLAMLLFRRGDVRPAREKVVCEIPDASEWKTAAAKYPQSFRELGFIAQVGSRAGGADPADATESPWCGERPLSNAAVETLRRRFRFDNIAQSASGELYLDAAKGVLKISAPRTAAITLPGGSEVSGVLAVRGADVPQTIALSSLDGKLLAESGRILLLHLTDTLNFQAKFSDANRNTLYKWGSSRLLVRRGRAEVSFLHRDAGEMEVFALHADGSVARQLPRRVENGRLFFTVDTALDDKGVLAYRISRRESNR